MRTKRLTQKIYLFGAGNNLLLDLHTQRDTIFALSGIFDSLSIQITQVTRLDIQGNLISKSIFSIPKKTIVLPIENSLIRTNDGGFVYAGWTENRDTMPPTGTLNKYDQYGNIQFFREYFDTSCYLFVTTRVVQDSYSNYYIIGYLARQNSITHVSDMSNMFLLKTDSLGNKIFIKEINDQTLSSFPYGLCLNKKGNIVLGGEGNNYYSSPNTTYYKVIRKVYEFDTSGNVVKYKWASGSDTMGPAANNLISTADGGYLLADWVVTQDFRNSIIGTSSVAKLDSDFNVVWRIDSGALSDQTIFSSLARCPDGNYIAAGRSWFEDPPNSTHKNGRLMKFKEDGTILWDRLYRGVSSGNDDNNFRSVGFLSNGDIIAGGEATNNVSTSIPQRSWLIRLDSMGCLRDSANCGVVVDGIENLTYTTGRIKLYPSPASDKLILEYLIDQPSTTHIQITNILGQIIFESHQSESQHSITIDVKDWPIGMYSYKLYSEKGFTSSASFTVSHD